MWTAWDCYRNRLCVIDNLKSLSHVLEKESLWIGMLGPDLGRTELLKAHKLWKLGFASWKDLTATNRWDFSRV